jgi:glycosyltransferase involved in cell wall biosynthesis
MMSVVIIARNEERFVSACVESVLAATSGLGHIDVVLVDSASTDNTAAIATRFPIRIVQLSSRIDLCPALARVVGERFTQGRYVLFVDGDTTISREWILAALETLATRPDVGGVGGRLRELYYDRDRIVGENPDLFNHRSDQIESVHQLGGNAIYRRAALQRVGSFNPYILSYEEAELAERLRRAGFSTVRLPIVVGTHRTGARGTIAELHRRYRENLMIGYGQVLRVAIQDGLFVRHAVEMKRDLQYLALLAASVIVMVVSVWRQDATLAIGWVGLQLLLFLAFALKTRSFRKPLLLLRDWSVQAVPLIRGFLRKPKNPRQFKVDEVVVSIQDLTESPRADLIESKRSVPC